MSAMLSYRSAVKRLAAKTICARRFLKSVQARPNILTGAPAIPKPWRSTAPIAKLNDAGSFIDKSPMKSGKQRRLEIVARRKKLAVKRRAIATAVELRNTPSRMVPVNEELLAPNNSYGAPAFVTRGYYVDIAFRCVDCGKEEVWTGSQQKWWYEIAK